MKTHAGKIGRTRPIITLELASVSFCYLLTCERGHTAKSSGRIAGRGDRGRADGASAADLIEVIGAQDIVSFATSRVNGTTAQLHL